MELLGKNIQYLTDEEKFEVNVILRDLSIYDGQSELDALITDTYNYFYYKVIKLNKKRKKEFIKDKKYIKELEKKSNKNNNEKEILERYYKNIKD